MDEYRIVSGLSKRETGRRVHIQQHIEPGEEKREELILGFVMPMMDGDGKNLNLMR